MVEETVTLPPMDDLAKAQFKFHAFTEACNDGRAVMIAMRHKDNNQRAFVTCVIDIAVEAGGIVNGEIRPVGFVIPDDDIFQSYNPPDIQGIIDQFLAARKAQADLMAAEEERINNFELEDAVRDDLRDFRHVGTIPETFELPDGPADGPIDDTDDENKPG